MPGRPIPKLAGQRIGRLCVLRFDRIENRNAWWLCVCECGVKKKFRTGDLNSGRVQSCGCYFSEIVKTVNITHGHNVDRVASSTLSVYKAMVKRCTNPNDIHYHLYGGRGITVCKRWLGKRGFENFLADMGERPAGLTIERRKVNRGYSPSNCVWATYKEQGNNKRDNRRIRYKGRTQNLNEWATELGLNRATIASRLDKLGWSVKDALSISARGRA